MSVPPILQLNQFPAKVTNPKSAFSFIIYLCISFRYRCRPLLYIYNIIGFCRYRPEIPQLTFHPMSNAELINKFYTSFQKKDYAGMQECYADQAVFNDEAFKNLNSAEVKAMWEMLCKTGKELTLTFGNISESATGGSAEWTASYLFSRTGKTVVNNVHAQFKIENGRIILHTDHFDFYIWAKQAFGIAGLLIGWTPYFRNKVQSTARESLNQFMLKNSSKS